MRDFLAILTGVLVSVLSILTLWGFVVLCALGVAEGPASAWFEWYHWLALAPWILAAFSLFLIIMWAIGLSTLEYFFPERKNK